MLDISRAFDVQVSEDAPQFVVERDTLRLGVEAEILQERLRLATLTGRPFGSDQFIQNLELTSNRRLRPQPSGRKVARKGINAVAVTSLFAG